MPDHLCRHFGTCGGCTLQDMREDEYLSHKRSLVTDALSRQGIACDVFEVFAVPPGTRRRATLKAIKRNGAVEIGFHAEKSHAIVDLRECPVLRPKLTALIQALRDMLKEILADGEDAELKLTDTATGPDLSLRWKRGDDADTVSALARWAEKLNLARVSRHGETMVELAKPMVRLGVAEVPLSSEAFLQPTEEGQSRLQEFVVVSLAKSKRVADLFSGCGTFSLPLAEFHKVHAVDIEAEQLAALAVGARTPGHKSVSTEKRNLFKRPLSESELDGFDAVCLDPPRAGAEEQAKALAKSKVKRIAYVSCDPGSFARDAAILIGGGFSLMRVQPVDQFLWSDHIELAGKFLRA
jgi:23S rRNA (uracil1939-C5)-methyltransferase